MRFWLREPLRAEAGEGDGGGGGTPAALDAASISKLISDGVNAALNGYDRKLQAKLAKLGQPAAQQQQNGSDEGDDDEGQAQQQPKAKQSSGVDPEVAKLRRQIEQLNKRDSDREAERAREKQQVLTDKKDAAVRKELAKFSFVDDEAFESAYARLDRDIRFAEDGSLVGGADDLPLGKFVGERMKKLDFLIKPKEVGGAGVTNGGKPGAEGEFYMENIRPGMPPEELARYKAKLGEMAKGLR